MTTGITCTVLLNGVEENDGSLGEDATDPVILSDLAVTWGRSDTMSQPGPDSCSFSVMDQAGGQAFVGRYFTGARIDVIARGDVSPTPAEQTFTNPGFETAEQTWAATAGVAARSAVRARTGGWSLALGPAAGGSSASVLLGPGPFQPAGTNPEAWDEIPTTTAGQVWTASASLWLPPGSRATLRPVLYTGPYSTAGTIAGSSLVLTGDGSWQEVTVESIVQTDDRWIGLAVDLSPVGYQWDQVPPAQTWDTLDPTWSWDDLGTAYLDDVNVSTPSEGARRSVLVFSGRITDLTAGWDDSAGCPVVEVTATGFTADLDNRKVGDEPWDVETVASRSERILELAGLPITIDIDPALAPIVLSYVDVDSQGATGLLQQIATSVDGVLWPAVHQAIGAYLRLEDPSSRASLLVLVDELGSPPVVLHTNLASNPSVEINANRLTAYGTATPARVSTWASSGSWSYQVTKTATSSQGAIYLEPRSDFVQGDQVTVGADVWCSADAQVVIAGRIAKSGAPGTAEGFSGKVTTMVAGVVQRMTTTYTVPAPNAGGTITAVGFQVYAGATLPVGGILRIDGITVERGATSGARFDGSTPDTATRDYAWTGAADQSTSTESTVQTHKIIIEPANPDAGLDLTACEILREPVTWIQTVSDVATRVSVSWLIQGVDDEGLPTTEESTVLLVDPALEATHGTRAVSVSTILQAADDADDVAGRILARSGPSGWRAGGLTMDDEDVRAGSEGVAMILELLDGTSRIGLPLVLGDLPDWTPGGASAGVYLEGGTYSFVSGRWILELLVSVADGLGTSAAWDDLPPSWQWDQWDPAITWDDLRGVAAL